jgi:hypothetical protein
MDAGLARARYLAGLRSLNAHQRGKCESRGASRGGRRAKIGTGIRAGPSLAAA